MSELAEKGHIERVSFGPYEREPTLMTCSVFVAFEASSQAFGNLVLIPEVAPDFRRELLNTFGVADMERLVGLPCIAYRCFGFHSEPIEAIGPVDSTKKLVIYRWARKFFPETPDPLEHRKQVVSARIDLFGKEIEKEKRRLETLESQYHPIPL